MGHYPDTAMPGQQGNFAIAGHRGSHGAPFADLPSLRVGDAVVVETPDGWYTYRFRTLEYVRPDGVGVLLPVPQQPEVQATDKLITMTTCSPRYG
ncbi:sortase, partial [Acinetobacter baumannii]